MGNQTPDKRGPEKKIKYGSVSCAVWSNEREVDGKTVDFKTVSAPTRNYQDKASGEWKTTTTLRRGDIDNAIRCLQDAGAYLNKREAD